MRIVALALAALGLLGCGRIGYPSNQSLAREMASETVSLVIAEDDKVYCSGVWVSKDLILTAAHCVDDEDIGDDVQYATVDDVVELPLTEVISPRNAVIVKMDETHDLALLKAPGSPEHEVATVATSEIDVGDSVETMGSPMGMVWTYSTGLVSAVRYMTHDEQGMWYVQVTAPISPGSSGCGLFNERGQLIGVARATIRNGQNLNLFIHRDYIKSFLSALP